MKILLVHNRYQQLGGEDTIYETEANLLESYGHRVIRYEEDNDKIFQISSLDLAQKTIWNSESYHKLKVLIKNEKPDVTHFHNTFPLVSPAAYYACKDQNIPTIQTLHNFRLLCPNGLFFRNEEPCEDCLGKAIPWPGIIHKCYRNSRLASTAVASMLSIHRLFKTWSTMIDIYIAYSQFAQNKFISGGIPARKLRFKTNFLHPIPEVGSGEGNFILFVGRIAPEKGLKTLITAWEKLNSHIDLKIVGDGPLLDELKQSSKHMNNIDWLGRQDMKVVYHYMSQATCLVISSEWYETFGRVGIEAMAKGTPLLVSNIGALAELVTHEYNGLVYNTGDSEDLCNKLHWCIQNPDKMRKLRLNARSEFMSKYTSEQNHEVLMNIYREAISNN